MSSPRTIVLSPSEVQNAAAIQLVIDRIAAAGGGIVVMPPSEIALDRGLRLRDGVTLRGSGSATILRKLPAREYPIAGYVNYGMRDLTLKTTAGLEAGMTVWIKDSNTWGFYETAATITWVEGNQVGLDTGLEADYAGQAAPMLRTMFSLIFAIGAQNVAVESLRLEGAAAGDPCALGGCRGGGIFFIGCRGITVSGVAEADFNGDGLSFQMCRDVIIRDSSFCRNTGSGLHPGAGSTNVQFINVTADHNGNCGLFFCVRVTRTTVTGCTFRHNMVGMSIGAYDCHNLISDCEMTDNRRSGIETRPDAAPCEVHHVAMRNCRIRANTTHQIHVNGLSHDCEISNCDIAATSAMESAITIDSGVQRIHLAGNQIRGTVSACSSGANLSDIGHESMRPSYARHLPSPCFP